MPARIAPSAADAQRRRLELAELAIAHAVDALHLVGPDVRFLAATAR